MTREAMRNEALKIMWINVEAIRDADCMRHLERRDSRLLGRLSMAHDLGIITDNDWSEIYDAKEKALDEAWEKINGFSLQD